ncbi:hypothetical protein D931_02815 [Enterococcus faecium 13.SD.W.09]|nr:hypothetical protein D931_02815 [Enterococcus faecium 13.SD.W.09]
MKKDKERLRPIGERPVEIVIGENIKKYYEESDYDSLTAFARDMGCDAARVRRIMGGKAAFSIQLLQRAAYHLNIKTLDLFEDWAD